MSLFQHSVLNKYLQAIDEKVINEAWEKFTTYFHNLERQENIRNIKEEEYGIDFLIKLFVNILGYTKNPDPNFNLKAEQKNLTDSKKADGAIIQDDRVIAVIELKGMDTTELGGKVEAQAFGYKNHQPEAVYVITSNFEKLRFYIDNAVDFEEFNLFQLTQERFKILWLCLAKENVFKCIPKKIKDESLEEEELITKKLYRDYSTFKHEIFNSIVELNPQYDELILFKKTQKLLDRFLFIFFAEDRLLLPPNSISEIIKQWTELKDKYDEYRPLYDRFKKYFEYMNTGFKGKEHSIFAYNGGLFKSDNILDEIMINDEVLYQHSLKLSHYDFESEVSVNILGHIFEHSLNEIEEITAELEGKEVDKSKTKRKKDGVYYTPKYITKYIVENTVGKLCDDKKLELKIIEEEYKKERKGRRKSTLKPLQNKLEKYRKWLLELTICDPACGSGAFLIQALDFLINEHRYIDELNRKLLGHSIEFPNVEKSILENNLYGVDINDEAVEIAKLSLWLRTARKGRKLTTLSNNIKCGNSLIDDIEVAGEKAFNWETEYPEIFNKGGFDMVIGNPPYGDYFSDNEKKYILENYHSSFSGTYDIYIVFFDLALRIGKTNGKLCFITPNTFIDYNQFKALRTMLRDGNNIEKVIGLTNVFEDAIVDSTIIALTKNVKQDNTFKGRIFKNQVASIEQNQLFSINSQNLKFDSFIIRQPNKLNVRNLINNHPKKLGDLVKITQGVTTGGNKYFINSKDFFLRQNIIEDDLKKVLKGKTINRYAIQYDNDYILYSTKTLHPNSQKLIEKTLEPHKEILSQKRETKQGKLPWYCLHWARNEQDFNEPKILIRQTAKNILGVYDNGNYYPIDTIHTLNLSFDTKNNDKLLKYLTGILNSKFFRYLYNWKLDEEGKVYPQVKKVNIEWLPIAKYKENENISDKVTQIQQFNEKIEIIRKRFWRRLSDNFNKVVLSNKIRTFQLFEFSTLINELKKQNILFKLREQDEWSSYFEEYKDKINQLQTNIDKTDREIDLMVYKLYGLTEREIMIVEEIK